MNNRISIIMTTLALPGEQGRLRIEESRRALESWQDNLRYHDFIDLHVADDGSHNNGYGVSIAEAPATWWKRGDVFHTRQIHRGVGASLNAGITHQCIVRQQQLIAYFVDDWILKAPLDLTPWAELLREQSSKIGMVRLGPPHPDLTGKITMFKQGWAIHLERHHYAFAMRPAIYHKSFFMFYGNFNENCSAIAAERDYNERFCTVNSGPGIILALPEIWDYSRQPSLSDAIPSDIAREFTQRSP